MLANSFQINIVFSIVSFVALWFGSGIIVNEVTALARSLKLSSFTLSFVLLGIMTSLPEATIGVAAVVQGDPQIFVGNLIGGVIVLYLLVIPVLALLGKGVRLPKKLDRKQLIMALLVGVAPSFMAADGRLGFYEGVLMVVLYVTLLLLFSKNESMFEKIANGVVSKNSNSKLMILKMLVGLAILVMASRQIVSSTEFFADFFGWSPFLISLLLVALGTNIPELSLAIRSIFAHKTDVAFADYVGSASANTLLFGLFTMFNGSPIFVPNHFLQRLILLSVGLVAFYVFARSKNTLSKKEALVLLTIYGVFVFIEISMA